MIVVVRAVQWTLVLVPLALLLVVFLLMMLATGFEAESRGFDRVFSAGHRLLHFAGLNLKGVGV